MSRLPVSVQSLFIQCAALLLAIPLSRSLIPYVGHWPEGAVIVFVQAAMATASSALAGQPRWWQLLHFAFVPSIALALQAAVPPWLYLASFVVLVLFYWSTFRTRVPLYLSDRKAWRALGSLLPQNKPFRFIDLGSGMGGVPLYLESRFPQANLTGTEIAPAPWLISRVRGGLKRSRVRFVRRDYRNLDLADYDVVFAFLSPAAMPALWRQAQQQMRPGSLFLSLSFNVEGRASDHAVALAPGDRHTLYAWRMQ